MQQNTDCAYVYQKFIISGVGQRLSPFVYALPVIFFLYFIFSNLLRASQDAFALVLKVFLNHCYFYFHERKVLSPSRKFLQILYVCACACICEFLKRVSKFAKPNPTRAGTCLLHEAFSKKILESLQL